MIGSLVARLVQGLGGTLRWRLAGLERWQGGVVLACWHGELVLGAALLLHLGRAEECLAPLVREYGQSGPMGDFARALGLTPLVVPGYEEPEARRAALATLVPALRTGRSVFLAADGHRAPRYFPRSDPLWLAAQAGVPLLPLALAAHPFVTLPTWDRKVLPLPSSRAALAIAEPMDGSEEEAALAERLAAARVQAGALLGAF